VPRVVIDRIVDAPPNPGYDRGMTRQSPDTDDYDDEEDAGPALARPPLSVLRTVTLCPECGRATRVYALGCAGFREAGDSVFVDAFFFLHHIRSLPAEVSGMLRVIAPGYRFDTEERSGMSSLMNHCGCGARLDDDFLHGDAGAAFFPDTPE
jgi:hypothetical protein